MPSGSNPSVPLAEPTSGVLAVHSEDARRCRPQRHEDRQYQSRSILRVTIGLGTRLTVDAQQTILGIAHAGTPKDLPGHELRVVHGVVPGSGRQVVELAE